MALPTLLAGPILRRVEPTLVGVWVALSKAADIRLSVWEGRVASAPDAGTPFVTSGETREKTWRLGDKLHLGLMSARIPPESAKSFEPDRLYSYDVEFKIGDEIETLASLGMLSSETGADGIAHVPLGYEPGFLPSFAPPPSELDDLRIIYGSCRKPDFAGPDAMVWIDDYILAEDRYKLPTRRPHQLFLGGDQIYADDVEGLHMLTLMELGQELIGRTGTGDSAKPIEHVRVDSFLHRLGTPDRAAPSESYVLPVEPTPGSLPADRAHFPEDHRLNLTQVAAQFTSTDGGNHLISVGEFAATYLTAWSNAPWGTEIPGALLFPDANDTEISHPLTWVEEVRPEARIEMPMLEFPDFLPQHLEIDPPKPEGKTPDEQQASAKKAEQRRQRSLRRSHNVHQKFLEGLPKVRRALANIATYMILDDHDVTDDYFLNPMWRDRVLTTSLGQTILRNGMLTYALFQDWGNDPVRYDEGLRAELLTRAIELFPEGVGEGPVQAAADRLDILFGHDQRNEPTPDGRFAPVTPPISWHFTIDGPKHRVVALDNRTRRSYGSRVGPPGNVSIEAQEDQVPKPPLPAGREILIVIAPLQVIGPPVLDDVVSPITYRLFDIAGFGESNARGRDSIKGHRGMPGTDPDAIESWAFDAVTFEHLLARLEPYQRVVVLSGDVHNSSGSLMSYWRKDAQRPARIAQFTSSGFKNVMPARVTAVDRSAGFAQLMIRAKLGIERLGWDRPVQDLILLPAGRTVHDLVPATQSRLRDTPVLLPTWGWPNDNQGSDTPDPAKTSRLNPQQPPDWRWRITPLLDARPDFDQDHPPPETRPASISPIGIDLSVVDQKLTDPETVIDAYQAIATRHQHALGHLRNARQILFRSNFGLVRFETRDDGGLTAIHEVVTAFSDPDSPTADVVNPETFLLQRADLGPTDEDPPTRLRAKVIEIPPQGSEDPDG